MLQIRRFFPDLPQAAENTSKWQQHFPVFQHNNGAFALTFAHPIQVKLSKCERKDFNRSNRSNRSTTGVGFN